MCYRAFRREELMGLASKKSCSHSGIIRHGKPVRLGFSALPRARKETAMPSIITEINQIGIVTDDIDRTIEEFKKLGLTDWSEVEVSPAGRFENYESRGVKGVEFGLKSAVNNELNIEVELIQPLDENSDYADFLKRNGGPGIHHISVDTDDQDWVAEQAGGKKLVGAKNKGIPIGFAYYDFRDKVGLITEYFPFMYPDES